MSERDIFIHTPGHRDCPACEALRQQLSSPVSASNSTFYEAAGPWLQARKPYLRERSFGAYQEYLKRLGEFFSELRLDEIHIGHFREYQTRRMAKAGPSRINHELNALIQILRQAGLWEPIRQFYEPLPLPRWTPPRVMTAQEKQRLFETATASPGWAVAYWGSVLSANTAVAGKELRELKLENIDLADGVLYVPDEAAKNEYRARVIPLNREALEAARECLKMAREKGAFDGSHYLFPYRVKTGSYDPTRPAKGWRTAWREMVAAAGITWRVRPYDLRHQALTELLEQPTVSEETVKAIAGHVGRRTLEFYSHIRIAKKRAALDTLSVRKPNQRSVENLKTRPRHSSGESC